MPVVDRFCDRVPGLNWRAMAVRSGREFAERKFAAINDHDAGG
jgi:hypothetical protein